MEAVLWYVLTGTRGGPNRLRALQALKERPRNANQLATELDLDYNTVRHHLEVLQENAVVKTNGNEYGSIYLITQQAQDNWDTIEEIMAEPSRVQTA